MKKANHLIAIREHLKEAIEGNRKRLSDLWERGVRSGELVDRLKSQMELAEEKYFKVIDELCPFPEQ